MWIRALLAVAIVTLAAAAPAAAGTTKVVASGASGATECTFSISKTKALLWFSPDPQDHWSFDGRTRCSVAVQQTAQAGIPGTGGEPDRWGHYCDTFSTTCYSYGVAPDTYTAPAEYRVTVTAPPGQLWVAPPQLCSGAGTRSLACTFTSQNVAYNVST